MFKAVDGVFHTDPEREFITHCPVCGDELEPEEKLMGICFWDGFKKISEERASQ